MPAVERLVYKDILDDKTGFLVYEMLTATQPEACMRTLLMSIAAITLATSPAMAFECPVGKGASVYDGVPGGKLRTEPRDDARVISGLKNGMAVAVLEVKPACRLPNGWVRVDHDGKSGYVRESDLRPRIRPEWNN
ncbi:SH3 domain-containing protein [Azospirillum sp. TSA6c]|uniref:SH3 domain-containing protein n=1 Tax=Azospirillum sp. TSA6c TaxID=709813 RepID=UPI0011B805D7|nr:SH3 domain-containing protein [Azospirillum sp. TSA6c]